jgi:hypothetical protein
MLSGMTNVNGAPQPPASQPPASQQGIVQSQRTITIAVSGALVMLAVVSWLILETEEPAVIGWAFAILAPAVSFLLSRVAMLMVPSVPVGGSLPGAFSSHFFILLALTEVPGLVLFVLGFVLPLSPLQVSVGLVLTAIVVASVLRPTRARAQAFVDRATDRSTYRQDVDEFLARF